MLIMTRNLMLFCISLLTVICGFSQTTYPKLVGDSLVLITTNQLKQTNLILLEHDKLSKENVLLNKKIEYQEEIITNYAKIDSLNILKQQELNNQITNLQSEIKRKSKVSLRNGILIGGGIGIAVTSLVFLLIR